MIIYHLSVSGFGIIGDPLEISFPEECRLGILGPNESGKTTLLKAIEYALYGLKKGGKVEEQRENIVTWGKNEAKLEIEFTSGQERYILERTINRTDHTAKLTQLTNGSANQSSALTSITEIGAKIEQITGMDRDSFSKLVYIKQKDLDALKGLPESEREQLVNKVMGIEVFDTASKKVKDDVKKKQETLNEKNIRMESVRRNKEQYKEKLKQKGELETAVSSLKQALGQKKVKVDEAMGLLEKYEWLYASSTRKEILSSLRDQLEGIQKDIKEIADLEERLSTYTDALANYKPKIVELEALKVTVSDLEKRLKESKDGAESLDVRMEEAIGKVGLTGRDLEALAQDLPRKKQHLLIGFGILLGISLIQMASGFFISSMIIGVVGLIFLLFSFLVLGSYLRIDKLLARSTEVFSLKRQETEQNKKVKEIATEIGRQEKQHGFKSSEEIEKAHNSILDELYSTTQNRSIEGLEAIINNTKERLNRLKDSDPSNRAKNLLDQIQSKKEEISNLEKTKPSSVDEFAYNRSQHEEARKAVYSLQTEYNSSEKEIQNKLGTINQLGIDLQNLKWDYDSYPQLEKEIKELKYEIEIRKLLLNELSETSKELRNKVIPHARFIINQTLPTLTDGRYSDFEITEDLKFKVHSMDAGGYKEREIFSGGTQDQFLIALRLAFTQSILDSRVMADKYSLLMDECISSSDETRKQGIFEVLEAMKKTFSQIFIIAHEDISNYVDHHMVLDRNRHGYTEIRSRSW